MAIETIINEKAGLPSKGRARLEYDPQGNSWFSVDADGNKKTVGGNSLSDYYGVIVVDPDGNGDYKTLTEAIEQSDSGQMIVVFGSLTEPAITLSEARAYTIFLPSPRTNINIPIDVTGSAQLNLSGPGKYIGTVTITGGSLNIYSDVRLTSLIVAGGTVYTYGGNITTFSVIAPASVRSVGAYINSFVLNADLIITGTGSWITGGMVYSLVGNEGVRTDAPFFNTTFFDPPANVSFATGNYTNVAVGFPSNGANWPPIP